MRTSVNIDADAYEFASAYAHGKGITLGAAISELLRRAEEGREPAAADSRRLKRSPRGYLIIAGTGDAITPEMVKEASEDELV